MFLCCLNGIHVRNINEQDILRNEVTVSELVERRLGIRKMLDSNPVTTYSD